MRRGRIEIEFTQRDGLAALRARFEILPIKEIRRDDFRGLGLLVESFPQAFGRAADLLRLVEDQ